MDEWRTAGKNAGPAPQDDYLAIDIAQDRSSWVEFGSSDEESDQSKVLNAEMAPQEATGTRRYTMPKRTDINTILVIGSGPIVIGQACEFDYSGAQACKVLKEEGYRVVLVNSNPATIMTDPDLVDRTYVEPITCEFIEKIIEREKPDALLATLGGRQRSMLRWNWPNQHTR